MSAVKTCGWSACQACAAMVRFVERDAAGEVTHHPPSTSEWWESSAADRFYRCTCDRIGCTSTVHNRLPHDHGEGSWP